MDAALALQPQVAAPIGLGELRRFVGLPIKKSARQLSVSTEELFKGIASVAEELILRAIEKRTSEDFQAARKEVFGDYVRTIRILAELVDIVVPNSVIERLSGESFSELEADLRDQGTLRFGTTAKDQAIFTVWTMRRTSSLISKIAKCGPAPEESSELDTKLASEFLFYASWTRFHLDCLMTAIRLDKPIHPEVLPEIIDGLRAAVNAHGLIRRGVDLRVPRPEDPVIAPVEWDEEDQELLDSSMLDMESEVL